MSEQIFYFIQQLLNGLTIGSTYALIAIGYIRWCMASLA